MDEKASLTEAYFTDVYTANADPWGYETSDYEREKYQATVAALPRDEYPSGLEIGCSIGVLSELLAAKCRALLAVDASSLPLERARQRLRRHPHVTVRQMAVPREFPREDFDLIVLSEVGYYWNDEDLRRVQQLLLEHLRPHGQLLLVHWTPFVPDYPLTGDEVHASFLQWAAAGKLEHLLGQRAEKYRLDLFARA